MCFLEGSSDFREPCSSQRREATRPLREGSKAAPDSEHHRFKSETVTGQRTFQFWLYEKHWLTSSRSAHGGANQMEHTHEDNRHPQPSSSQRAPRSPLLNRTTTASRARKCTSSRDDDGREDRHARCRIQALALLRFVGIDAAPPCGISLNRPRAATAVPCPQAG